MKKIKYKGKIWVEYKQPLLKSWMMGLLTGVLFGYLYSYLKGWWAILNIFILFVFTIFIQIVYERELEEEKQK